MNKTIRNLTLVLIIVSVVFLAGCTGKERTTPVQTTVSTPSLTTNIDADSGGVRLSGFLVQPVTPGKYPGIVMIHEWWGLNDQVKSMADIIAREGYVVLAVDLFKGNVATTIEGAQSNIRNNLKIK